MPATSETAARPLQRLAALIVQRRAMLGWSQEKVAEEADMAVMTYRRIEEAQRVQPATYAKAEKALELKPGSCRAVLDGATSIWLLDGTELLEGSKVTPVSADWLEDGVRQSVINAAIGTLPQTTGEKTKQLSDAVITELRRRGILPTSD